MFDTALPAIDEREGNRHYAKQCSRRSKFVCQVGCRRENDRADNDASGGG